MIERKKVSVKTVFQFKTRLDKMWIPGDLMTWKFVEKLFILHCYNCI